MSFANISWVLVLPINIDVTADSKVKYMFQDKHIKDLCGSEIEVGTLEFWNIMLGLKWDFSNQFYLHRLIKCTQFLYRLLLM